MVKPIIKMCTIGLHILPLHLNRKSRIFYFNRGDLLIVIQFGCRLLDDFSFSIHIPFTTFSACSKVVNRLYDLDHPTLSNPIDCVSKIK
jgi:hypothetical protein